MSTQLWWLLLTRYHPPRRRPSKPVTSQWMRWTRAIQAPFTAIQASARALSTRSAPRRAAPEGSTSFSRATGIMPEKMVTALAASTEPAKLPFSVIQNRLNIGKTPPGPPDQTDQHSETGLLPGPEIPAGPSAMLWAGTREKNRCDTEDGCSG